MWYRTVVKTTKPDNQIWYLVSWYDTGCGLQRPSYIIYPDGNWWQLMATDGNWRQHNGSSVQKTVQMRDQLCRVTQCQVHSKSADMINTVRLTGTGLDTKLSYTIYDDRIIPTLFTRWQMCKSTVSVTYQYCRYPGDYPSENFSMRRQAGTGQHSSVRTSMLSSHLLPIQIFIFHDIRLSMLPD